MKYYDINSYSSCRPNKAIKDDLGCHKSQIQEGRHKNRRKSNMSTLYVYRTSELEPTLLSLF